MNHACRRYVPALGFDFLTPFYDPRVAATTRERIFKRRLIAQAAVRDGERVRGALVTGVDADQRVLSRARRTTNNAGVEVRWDRAVKPS